MKMFKSRSTPTHAGGARKGQTSQWKVLAEEEPVTLAEKMAADPILVAMQRGDISWADAIEGPLGHPSEDFIASMKATAEIIKANTEAAAVAFEMEAMEEASIWHQSFSHNLEQHGGDCFDLSLLSTEEEAACMTWLYAKGWHTEGSRTSFTAYPADLPPRVWVADRFAALLSREEETEVQAPAPAKTKKAAVTVPRFCRASSGGVACADATCRYVHADTMARLDKPCGFGAACGGTDPAKRAACLYMHPGETWDATLIVTRPQASVTCGATASTEATPCSCAH